MPSLSPQDPVAYYLSLHLGPIPRCYQLMQPLGRDFVRKSQVSARGIPSFVVVSYTPLIQD